MSTIDTEELEKWAADSNGPVALHLKQKLTSVECINDGDRCIIYPPTYADIGYNIDKLSDGKQVALVDSVGSQANRMEPIFKSEETDRNKWLVPQIQIALGEAKGTDEQKEKRQTEAKKAKGKDAKVEEVTKLSLLDLAHRGADAVVQSSGELGVMIRDAFITLRRTGDAGPLCVITPTSLVFGVWDSRGGSSEKRPRLVRSIIRAWDVEVLHAAAQFNSVWKDLDENSQKVLADEAKKQGKKLSTKGFADAPATFRPVSKNAATSMREFKEGSPNPERRVLGGVLVKGDLQRDVTVNLVALRSLCAGDDTGILRQYLLGLALIAATADTDLFLREGCNLRSTGSDQWYSVPRRGEPTKIDLTSDAAKARIRTLAQNGAKHFSKSWPKQVDYVFDIAEAKKLLAKKEEEEVQPE